MVISQISIRRRPLPGSTRAGAQGQLGGTCEDVRSSVGNVSDNLEFSDQCPSPQRESTDEVGWNVNV